MKIKSPNKELKLCVQKTAHTRSNLNSQLGRLDWHYVHRDNTGYGY